MTVATNECKQTNKESGRCPVFKIDLKGQFVNIDDLTSDLLGLPAENLFGRNIKEFLDKDSYKKLFDIIQYGNRFDSCYESIELEIIDYNKRHVKLNAIASLNFIAGNPSNYQIILLEWEQPNKNNDNSVKLDLTLKRIFKLSTDFTRNPDWKKLAELLVKNLELNQIGIYKYENKTLSLLGDAAKQKGKGKIDLTQTEEDHQQVIDENKQSIILKIKKNSFEYSYPLNYCGSCWGLLRCIAGEESSELENELGSIAGYIGAIFGTFTGDNSKNEETKERVIEPGVDVLDVLKLFGCTIISFKSDGSMVPAFSDFPENNHILAGCSNVNELAERLRSFELISFSGRESLEITISNEHPIIVPELCLISDKAKLYLFKILNTKEISQGLAEYTIILFPEFDNSVGRKTSDKLLSMFLETASLLLEPIDKCAAKMAGQFYPRLNKDGRFYVDTIQDNCQVLYGTIKRYKQLCEIVSRKENAAELNITELITGAIKEFQIKQNDLVIKLESTGHIFMTADANRITEALNAIFTGLISQTVSDNNPAIGVKVSAQTDYCRLEINSSGNLESNFDPQNALEPLASIKEIPLSGLTAFENELPMARLLVESIGGEMELSKTAENRITIIVNLPSVR